MNSEREHGHRSKVEDYRAALTALLAGLVILSSLSLLWGATVIRETISIDSLRLKAGARGWASLRVDHLPNGISGYSIAVSLSEPGIALIKDVEFVAFDGAREVEILPDGSAVTFSAIDTGKLVQPGAADVELAKIELEGLAEGVSAIQITIRSMDDDNGTAIEPIIQNARLEITVTRLPVADFSFLPLEPTALDMIQFVDRSSDPDGVIISWQWDFGDGTTSTERNPSHRYRGVGVYIVSLTVIDSDHNAHQIKKEVKVRNVPPKAHFTFSPEKPRVDEAVSFDASESADPDGRIVLYEWDWDSDGVPNETTQIPITQHSFLQEGSYTVTLRVRDDAGETTKVAKAILVAAVMLPAARFSFSPLRPTVGTPILFNAAGSHDPSGRITEYAWDFNGDGKIDRTTREPVTEYIFDSPGRHEVRLVVSGSGGSTATTTRAIEVLSPLPPLFVSAGVAPTDMITIMKGGLGVRLTNHLVGHMTIGFGSGSTTKGGFEATVEVMAIDVSLLYRISESMFMGPGAGLIILHGHYHIDWPTLASKSFDKQSPVLSLSIGMSLGGVLAVLSLHIGLQ